MILEKLMSRKLWVLVMFVVVAMIDGTLAQDIMPAVMAYALGQGLADMNKSL